MNFRKGEKVLVPDLYNNGRYVMRTVFGFDNGMILIDLGPYATAFKPEDVHKCPRSIIKGEQ